jgi:hypothetical protein
MGQHWHSDDHGVTKPHLPAMEDYAHHARFPHQIPASVAAKDRPHEARREVIELRTWIAKPC